MIHQLNQRIHKDSLPKKFTYPFCYTPHELCVEASMLIREEAKSVQRWREELDKGKMFGVLIVETQDEEIGFLAAFSGNMAGENRHPYFVPPICDLLDPNGFFILGEKEISKINEEISVIENSQEIIDAKENLAALKSREQERLSSYVLLMKEAKRYRKERRAKGDLSFEEDQMMRLESQQFKGGLKRLEAEIKNIVSEAEQCLEQKMNLVHKLKEERARKSANLQKEIFHNFKVYNAKGESRDIEEVFNMYSDRVPPAGTGECAAPKLLNYAYINKMKPIAMAEFWIGGSPENSLRRDGSFYPSCNSKCEPLLNFMLEGLDVEESPLKKTRSEDELKVVYEDDYYLIVDKPSGMLSTPGKENSQSVYNIIRCAHPEYEGSLVVHRLDMATSGLLVVAKTEESFVKMQQMFERREVTKRYEALLDGDVAEDVGVVDLPMILDVNDRPRQMVDKENGKTAITKYEVVERKDGKTRVKFYPLTGRSHQLRVHAAHKEGLNAPICGDTLYGTPGGSLQLRAEMLAFRHPFTGKKLVVKAT